MDQAMLERITALNEAYARAVKNHSDACNDRLAADIVANHAFDVENQRVNEIDIAHRDLMAVLSEYAATLPSTPAQ